MSSAIVAAEISRFLASSEPEVLCISGQWGVGKTYAWQKFLQSSIKDGAFALERYAYVSLFGVNSLPELRFTLVENTVDAGSVSKGPDAWSLRDVLKKGEQTLVTRTLINAMSGAIRIKDGGDALYRAAFLTVRSQLVCFDDLERSGKGIELREVFGLTSMLREQRDCKIVLLFNQDAFTDETRRELDDQLEKVVDTFLRFEPTSAEAAAIAIEGKDALSVRLRERIEALGFGNIRVIKKIERMVRRVATVLEDYHPSILDSAVSTVVLAGWSFLQAREAPPIEYLRNYNEIVGGGDAGRWLEETTRWRDPLMAYGYYATDELDLEIMDSIARGYFDDGRLKQIAAKLQKRSEQREKSEAFSGAWDLYHGDVTIDDDDVLDTIFSAAMENIEVVSPPTLNGTVEILRMYGRDRQATELIARFMATQEADPSLLDPEFDPFLRRPIDPELQAAVNAAWANRGDDRDPGEMLRTIAQNRGYNPGPDIARLRRLSTEDWVALFDAVKGRDLQRVMRWALVLARQPEAGDVLPRLTQALERIADRSPMRRHKLQDWGCIPVDTPGNGTKDV